RGAGQALATGDDDGVALDLRLGAHALQLEDVHEAVFEHVFDDHAGAFGDGIECRELRLHVGRKTGVGRGVDVHRAGAAAVHVQLDPVLADADVGAGVVQLGGDRAQKIRARVAGTHLAARDRAGDQVGAGFDAVGQHAVRGAVQRVHAVDDDHAGAGALDARAHAVQAFGQVHDLRL